MVRSKQEIQEKVITRRALALRINRQLFESTYSVSDHNDRLPSCVQLKKSRGRWEEKAFGQYYLFDELLWRVRRYRVDLERLGRELSVLAPHETLESDDSEQKREVRRLRERRARDARRAVRVARARKRDVEALPWAHPAEDRMADLILGRKSFALPVDDELVLRRKAVEDARNYLDRLDNISLLR